MKPFPRTAITHLAFVLFCSSAFAVGTTSTVLPDSTQIDRVVIYDVVTTKSSIGFVPVPMMTAIDSLNMSIEVPESGSYQIDLYAINGEKVASYFSELTSGVCNNLMWNPVGVSPQVLTVHINNGAGVKSSGRVIFR